MRMPGFILLLWTLASCQHPSPQLPDAVPQQNSIVIPGKIGDIPLPDGYKRIEARPGDYTSYLRDIGLKKDKTVYLYNGNKKANQQAQYAVINFDAGTKDLQQCADAVMRIRAEYLFSKKKYDQISFSFTNGFACDFDHYAQGYRLRMNGNNYTWSKQKPESYAYKDFREYLNLVYSYAGTKSLHRQLRYIPMAAMHPGAVFIQTRDPYGHAVTVMDMAYNPKTNDTIFLLSQSYMPAQDIHVLVNPGSTELSPWYSTHSGNEINTPEWDFTRNDLKEF
jgi:hypothetical protein